MGYYKSIDHLKKLADSSVRGTATVDELFDFLREVNEENSFSDIDANFYVLVILLANKKMAEQHFLLENLFNELQAKLILSILDNNTENKAQNCPNPPAVVCDETQKSPSNNEYDIEEVKAYFLDQFKSFPRSENPGLIYPEGDELTNVQVPRVKYKQKLYNLNFLINSEGTVIRFREDPTELKDASSYEDIYANLVGKIMEYQKG